MNYVDWNLFELNNKNKEDAFEEMCRTIFLRKFNKKGHDFSCNYNQTGLEIEPTLVEGVYYGFQCKYNKTSSNFYRQLLKSLKKAIESYKNRLDVLYVYSNLDIKPNCSKEEVENKAKNSDRVKINRLANENGIVIKFIQLDNFKSILNEHTNYDIYSHYFSNEEVYKFLRAGLSEKDIEFINSKQFIDLDVNNGSFDNQIKEILSQKVSYIIGSAGAGKSEIMKKLCLVCYERFQKIQVEDRNSFPIFIKLKEVVNGDLEDCIRNKLNDYKINYNQDERKYIYFFDGLDEVSTEDFKFLIAHINNLFNKENTESIIISSRLSTYNLSQMRALIKGKEYKINDLDKSKLEAFFYTKADDKNNSKIEILQRNNYEIYNEITDVFSANLLWNVIKIIDDKTTKIDLVNYMVNIQLKSNFKGKQYNLPKPLMSSIMIILKSIAFEMCEKNKLIVSRINLQIIIKNLFQELSYIEVDEIIDFISEVFFDSNNNEEEVTINFTFKHKRYYEYFLYLKLKDLFYDNPFILRELNLFTDKEILLNIFIKQELSNSKRENDLYKNAILNFVFAYLGDDYTKDYKNLGTGEDNMYLPNLNYTEHEEIIEFLCTKSIDDIIIWLKKDDFNLNGILDNKFYLFVRKYFEINGKNIKQVLINKLSLSEEFLENERKHNEIDYIFIDLVLVKRSYIEVYNYFINNNQFDMNDDIYIDYKHANYVKKAYYEILKIGIDYYFKEFIELALSLNSEQLEILVYLLLRDVNLKYLFNNKYEDLKNIVVRKIAELSEAGTKLGINTIVFNNFILNKFDFMIDEVENKFN